MYNSSTGTPANVFPHNLVRANLPAILPEIMNQITAVTFDLWQTLLLDNRELGLARALLRLEGTRDALAR